MGLIKKMAESIFNYRIEKLPPLGIYPYKDIANLVQGQAKEITVLDVGANEGQSVVQFQENIKPGKIHCFEPNKIALEKLKNKYDGDAKIVINNCGLGAKSGMQSFYENEVSDMSSFLELGEKGWGKTGASKAVPITTLDNYCIENNIEYVDILKIDTQGFELEVLKGSHKFLQDGKINLILMEVTFANIYNGLPSFDQLYKLMMESGFRLVTFYGQHYHDGLISWTDVLFINERNSES